ncbi:MAG: Gfo/Idh/MocA family oxidoreductase [Verrucomicrobia bacterium]|nr:Gfo/Idh/MocA family oxidoreductase [Verrucomicrobiota bacterium]
MVATQKIRYAIVGCGLMGHAHGFAVSQDPNGELVLCIDPKKKRTETLAGRFGGKPSTNYEACLTRKDVDAVVLAVPHSLHCPLALQAFAAGKHVMVEKPIACTLKESDQMIQASRRGHRLLFVAHVLRFRKSLQLVKRILDEGILGAPVFARYHNEHYPKLGEFQAWLANHDEGGVFVSGAVHHTDLMRWWMGEVRAVTGHAIQVRPEYKKSGREDCTMIVYDFKSGAMGESTYSYASIAPQALMNMTEASVVCTEGQVLVTHDHLVRIYSPNHPVFGDRKGFVLVEESQATSLGESGSAAEVPHFSECILKEREPLITAQDARRALELALAARDSAASGKRVDVSGGSAAVERNAL